ncbi:MAG: hypothetical protein EBX53_07230, partial [Betaproteobacteria bacterium]|nr:hypothetical protein [Betaproteobacteria bacterium]
MQKRRRRSLHQKSQHRHPVALRPNPHARTSNEAEAAQACSTRKKRWLLRLEVRADPPNPWVGQAVQLTVRILIRPYTSTRHGVSLDEGQMWRLLDTDASEWGALKPRLIELAQANRRPVGNEEVIDGRTWIVYELDRSITPDRAGPVDLGDLRVVWRYPTGLSTGRDFFAAPEL